MRAGSRLEKVLRSGRFAVTAELNPPDSADPQAVYERALVLAEVCDAINATDASGANVHMSSVGVCALLTRAGYEPVLQVSCRDRNRIALQGDLLGAAAMGVRNVLCLTGDGVQAGDQPEAKPVFDLDAISLLRMASTMRDQGRFLSGRALETAPHFFLGAAANPFAPPFAFRAQHLKKKVDAGAEFIQTQFCFDIEAFKQFMARFATSGCTSAPSSCREWGHCARRSRPSGCKPISRAWSSPRPSCVDYAACRPIASARKASGCALRSFSSFVRSQGSAVCMSWPSGRKSSLRKSSRPPGCCHDADRTPHHRGLDKGANIDGDPSHIADPAGVDRPSASFCYRGGADQSDGPLEAGG